MRNDNMITKGKCFDLLSNSLNLFFNEMYRDKSGEIACECWVLKGQKFPPYCFRYIYAKVG